ncbi:hypothetical protein ON010_g9695 [Phytophthora cinnamomi]|nr:hypothetical protein ON010_g9695 [Phytophthora cinnamomi]
MQALELPLPDQLQVRLTVKTGDPLTACRDKLAPINFIFKVATGYRGLRGAVEEMFGRHLPNVWRQKFDLNLKPNNNAPKRDFSVIQAGEHEFNVQLETVWHTARLRKNGQADFQLMVEYHVVRVMFEGTPIPLRLNIADSRLAPYSLRPPYRSPPTTAIPDPEVDMEDVDHRQQDG